MPDPASSPQLDSPIHTTVEVCIFDPEDEGLDDLKVLDIPQNHIPTDADGTKFDPIDAELFVLEVRRMLGMLVKEDFQLTNLSFNSERNRVSLTFNGAHNYIPHVNL